LIAKINSGEITDIIDIGAGGALNPDLRIGDLVLSTEDRAIGLPSFPSLYGNKFYDSAKMVADYLGTSIHTGPILTTDKIISAREERLNLFNSTGSHVVQMEHYWFLNDLKGAVNPDAFENLRCSHLELISDRVPPRDAGKTDSFYSLVKALDICLFRNQGMLGNVKTIFLNNYTK
jgi:hypothetical protein